MESVGATCPWRDLQRLGQSKHNIFVPLFSSGPTFSSLRSVSIQPAVGTEESGISRQCIPVKQEGVVVSAISTRG